MRNLLQILILALSIRSIVSFLPLVTSTRKSLTLIHTTPKCQSSTYPLSCIHKNQRLSYYLQRSLSLSKATVSLGVTTASTSIEADIDANGDLSKMLQEKIYSIKKYENDDNKPNQKNIDDDDDDNQKREEIKAQLQRIIQLLENQYKNKIQKGNCEDNNDGNEEDIIDRFKPALGLYNVSYVQSAKEGENPVGGKWTRKNRFTKNLITIRRTMQHLVPLNSTVIQKQENHDENDGGREESDKTNVVAQAVNVIVLDALWKLIRFTIILRGDAVPLSKQERQSTKMKEGPLTNLAVKAFFDPPRIILGVLKGKRQLLNLQLGPKSSVVLDTTFLDDKIRIGKGGTSGTRFIFTRCSENDLEAEEFKQLLDVRPMKKTKIVALLVAISAAGAFSSAQLSSKLLGRFIAAVASFMLIGVMFSTGGIEQDRID